MLLWKEFNYAWLAIFQKQKNHSEPGISSHLHGVLGRERIQNMVDDLIKWCDDIKKHGLVGYEYGVWEDDIITGTSHLLSTTTFH
jgi:hypothetical protein